MAQEEIRNAHITITGLVKKALDEAKKKIGKKE